MKKPDIWGVTERETGTVGFVGDWANLTIWLEQHPDASERHERAVVDHCGCCGTHGRLLARLPCAEFGADWFFVGGDTPREVAPGIFRCEKHVGRNPCLIDGCGRTFAHSNGEDYGNTVICGRHWREAPKRTRDLCAKVCRKAKRIGWTNQLSILHDKLWNKCLVAIREGREIDQDEINKMFGWDE